MGRVLIVDDIESNRFICLTHLQRMGLQCSMANDGESAVQMVEKDVFDLILMDCELPGISGWEASAKIRQMESSHQRERQVIIAVTANLADKNFDIFRKSGIDDFLAKPYERKDLEEILDRYLPQDALRQLPDLDECVV